jgi:putative DNA primase/helicase
MKTIEETIAFFRKEGINFIPIRPREKKPLIGWKEFMSRKITDEEVEKYFNGTDNGIAAVCGEISKNLFVIDADSIEIFDAFFPKKKDLVYVKTGRGAHIYFRAESPVKPLKMFDESGKEIMTLKSTGGYVLGPGSIHSNGSIYEMINPGPIPTLYGNVREDMMKRASSIGLTFTMGESKDSEVIDIQSLLFGVPQGNRDNAATLIIHYLRRQNATKEEAFEILQKWNKLSHPPMEEIELFQKLDYHYSLPEAYKFFFRTNPTHSHITSDLKLSEILDSNKILTIEDVLYDDETGTDKINMDILLDFVEQMHTFKTFADNGELLVYNNGLYVHELGEINTLLEKELGSKAPIRFKAEVHAHIRDRNVMDRSKANADKRELPVKNGILNLDTLTLEPFTSDKVFTTGLDVLFDPEAVPEAFIKAIHEILPGNDSLTMQEVFGYCLWRDYPTAKSFWLIGSGGNGKTVLMTVLINLLSSANVSHIALSELDGHHRFAVFELYDKLLNIVAEPETARPMETPLFKAMTGRDRLVAEQKGVQKRFSFVNFAKQIVYANSIPQIADDKQGLWDRIFGIKFGVTFRGRENENLDLGEELSTGESLSGVLNWALEGLARLRKNNWSFTTTSIQQAMKTTMQITSNPVGAFKDNWLVLSRKIETPTNYIFDAFELFSVIHGISHIYPSVIGKELQRDSRITAHRIRREGMRTRVFQGCRLSEKIVACYGWYRGRALHMGELDEIEDPEKEVEVRTCSLVEYCEVYVEPAEETEEVINDKSVVFNTEELIPLYKKQLKVGTVKHIGPHAPDLDRPKKDMSDISTIKPALFIKALTALEEGLCERCGRHTFLTHVLTDEDTKKSLICSACAKEVESDPGIEKSPIFGTTLEERRAMLKEEEKGGKNI